MPKGIYRHKSHTEEHNKKISEGEKKHLPRTVVERWKKTTPFTLEI